MTAFLFVLLAATAAPGPTEQVAIFTAAGFKKQRGQWRTECDQPGQGDYQPGAIETFGDLNGDGRPEAVVTEGGSFCYGDTGTGFTLLTRAASGKWTSLYKSQGMATVLKTRANGWPEIEVGGPGFCFPVLRWTGNAFAVHRHAYDGKRCKP